MQPGAVFRLFALLLSTQVFGDGESGDYNEKGNVHENSFSSSMWCVGNDPERRTCFFQNLCYGLLHKTFVFFHSSENSATYDFDYKKPLLFLSPIYQHFPMNLVVIDASFSSEWKSDTPSSSATQKRIIWHDGKTLSEQTSAPFTSFLMRRFKPDNAMHVLHDDVIPVYHELKSRWHHDSSLPYMDSDVFFLDEYPAVPLDWFYKTLTNRTVYLSEILKSRFEYLGESDLLCWRSSRAGFDRSTIWYQYGFSEPQGPLPYPKSLRGEISQFSNHVLSFKTTFDSSADQNHQFTQSIIGISRFGEHFSRSIDSLLKSEENFAMIITRERNRLILNQDQLAFTMLTSLSMTIIIVPVPSIKLFQLIQLISRTKILVCMHGAELAASMFLPASSVIVEMFPHAIDPLHYTPYKTLSAILGHHYTAWVNKDLYRTVGHPYSPASQGGISHIEYSKRKAIMRSSVVPRHLCCDNPTWLYKIYQDTVVDVKEVVKLVLISQRLATCPIAMFEPAFATPVGRLMCTSVPGAGWSVSWVIPWNVKFLSVSKIRYDAIVRRLHVKKVDDERFVVRSCDACSLPLIPFLGSSPEVWVRCVLDEHAGKWAHMQC